MGASQASLEAKGTDLSAPRIGGAELAASAVELPSAALRTAAAYGATPAARPVAPVTPPSCVYVIGHIEPRFPLL